MALLLGVGVCSLGGSEDALAAWPEAPVEATVSASLGTKEVDVKLIDKPASTTFDGKAIDQALAATIAGKRTLLAWGNCSVYQKRNGSYTTKRFAVGAKAVQCMYLVTGTESTFEEYFVLDEACTGTGKACLNGYTVESRIDNKITTNPHSHTNTIELVREIHQNSALESGADAKKAGGLTNGGMRHKATVHWSLSLGIGSRSYHYELRDAAGNLIGTPMDVVRSDSSKGVAQNSCAQLGADVENFLQMCAVATGSGMALGGTLIGGVLGYVLSGGTGAGVIPGVAVGTAVGGSLGGFVAAVGQIYGFLAGKAAQGVCNQMASPKPGGGGGPLDPGAGPGADPDGGDEVACKRCLKSETQYGSLFSVDENGDVTVTGYQEIVCTKFVVESGTDENFDGWCD